MPKLHLALILSLLALAAGAVYAQQDSEALYDVGLQAFRAGSFEEAVRQFELFRMAAPGNPKADDALWYVGRALAGLGRTEEAVRCFEEVRMLGPQGNRYVEACTELARLRLDAEDPAAAVALLEPLAKQQDLDTEDRRALRLLAGARVELGRLDWSARRDSSARVLFGKAVTEYELLLREPSGEREQLGLQEELGRAYLRLMEAAGGTDGYGLYRQAALAALDLALELNPSEPKRARLQRLREQAAIQERVRLSGRVEAFGGADDAAIQRPTYSSAWAPGAQVSAQLALGFPLGWQQRFEFDVDIAHDDFGRRTFNFAATEMDVGRILQRTEDFGASLSWEAGSSRGLRSILEAGGGYRLAEDPELSGYWLKAKEKLDWRAGPAWKLELDGSFAWSVYPGYATGSGRELDHWLAGVKPQSTWYLTPDFSVGLGYAFRFKQYLDASYLSSSSKQYYLHAAELTLRATPGGVFHPTLTYSLAYNETRNYDVDLTGIGGTIVRDYYDYYENALDLGLLFKWSPDFRTELDAKAALRSFLNYPARNAAGDALTGQKRRDFGLGVDAELSYRIWSKQRNRFGDLWSVARLSYARNSSNSSFEEFFQTNYSSLAVTGGLSLEFK
jgi:tetratricopeptide (TPR) repeat protein